jgi:putative redox protein
MSLETLIEESRGAIETDTAVAEAVFSVEGNLVGLTEVDLLTRGHAVKVDEPPTLGGQDLAANPVEHALIALASCQAITYPVLGRETGHRARRARGHGRGRFGRVRLLRLR